MVTAAGGEMGRAQWVQAIAAGAEPEVAMNPVLLKPTGERTSQVVVMGRPVGVREAGDYQASKRSLVGVVDAAWRRCGPASTSSSARAPAARPRSTSYATTS